MKLIKPSHEILAMSGHDDLPHSYSKAANLIEVAGRTCYKSEAAITQDSSEKFVRNAEKAHHLTVIEHSWLTATVDHIHSGTTRPTNWNKYLYLSQHWNRGGLLVSGNRRAWKEALSNGPIHKVDKIFPEGMLRKFSVQYNEPYMMSATVRLINDRGVSHEEVRHRPPVFSQESTRYVDYLKRMMQFVLPLWVSPNNFTIWAIFNKRRRADLLWLVACWCSEFMYRQLINHGWAPQQARDVLINSLKTELVMSCNLQEWQHIFVQRALGLTGKPHPQMVEVMQPLMLAFRTLEPTFFSEEALKEYFIKAYPEVTK
jgi:thymidylate synthase (FAD)